MQKLVAAAFAVLVMVPSIAAARGGGPVAATRFDIDGDGDQDDITVDADGRLMVAPAGAAGSKPISVGLDAPGKVDRATVTVGAAEGHVLVVVRAHVTGAEAGGFGAVVEARQLGLARLWTGPIGPQGADAEYQVVVDLVNDALVRYETRGDVTTCEGVPARLFLHRWDFASDRFRPVSVAPPSDGATSIRPARGTPPQGLDATTRPTVFRFESATTHAGDGGTADGLTAPREIDDGDAKTAWSEDLGGHGRGEILTARGIAKQRVRALRLIPGDASSPAAFAKANRLKRIVISVGSKRYSVELATDPALDGGKIDDPYWIVLPSAEPASCVSVAVDQIWPGKDAKNARGGRTAISELVVLTELEAGGEEALADLAETVARGGEGAATAVDQLARQGARGVKALVTAADRERPVEERRRVRLALAKLADPAGARQIVLGLRETDRTEVADAHRRTYVEALVAMEDAAVPEVAALLADASAPSSARVAAAEVLAASSAPSAREALAAACGAGERSVRRAVTIALGSRGADELGVFVAEAGSAERSAACRADLWRVVTLIARRAPEGDGRTAAARAAAQAAAAATEYELRYRLAQALGALAAEPAAREALTALLATEKEPALRLVAVEAVGARVHGASGAADLLIEAIDDADPGVRAAALLALNGRAEDASTDGPVLERLAADRWPHVRRAAAEVLSTRCRRAPAADGLYRTTGEDPSEDVRETALSALVRCKEPRIGKRLIELARDRNLTARLRERAASLLGPLGDRSLTPEVISLMKDAASQSIHDEDNMRVAAAAALALGVLGDARAAEPLMDQAVDPVFPPIQVAAVTALGDLCPAGAAQLLADLTASPDKLISRAARLAWKKCKK